MTSKNTSVATNEVLETCQEAEVESDADEDDKRAYTQGTLTEDEEE
jgi:hypothetical protein